MTDAKTTAPAPTPAPAPAAPAAAKPAGNWLAGLIKGLLAWIASLWSKLTSGSKITSAMGTAGTWVVKEMPIVSHVFSAVYISLKDWHVLVFWAVLGVGVYWYACDRTEKEWAPVGASLTSADAQVKTLNAQNKKLAADLIVAQDAAKACAVPPAAKDTPAAAPAAAPAQKPHAKKRAPKSLFGIL